MEAITDSAMRTIFSFMMSKFGGELYITQLFGLSTFVVTVR
jgi:hypothetical protein